MTYFGGGEPPLGMPLSSIIHQRRLIQHGYLNATGINDEPVAHHAGDRLPIAARKGVEQHRARKRRV